ncbi:MAG: trehalase family glycosidase [Candidatus Aminicenantales bacterium]
MTHQKNFLIAIFCFILGTCLLLAEVYYPWKEVYIGALDGKAWAGVVFAPHKKCAFAFRIQVQKEDQIADSNDLFYLISEVGPNSPDGLYARVKFDLGLPFKQGNDTPVPIKPSPKSDTLQVEWSRQDEKTIIGRIQGPKFARVHFVFYSPWDLKGLYRLLPDGQILGNSKGPKESHYILWTHRKGDLLSAAEGEEVKMTFSLEKERTIYFVAGVGENVKVLINHIYRYKNRKTIDTILEEEEDRYRKKRVKIEGLFEGVPESITNNIFWTVLYQAGNHRFYTPAGRRWIYSQLNGSPDHWTIFELDSFFNALEVSVESSKHTLDIIRAVLETQYPNGNIPHWRGRFVGSPDHSQPPVGSYVVLKLFQKLGDMELLQTAYPYLKKWHSFWKAKKPNGQARRDGNNDGLLEWGFDRELMGEEILPGEENKEGKKRAMWESGQDDLPNWKDAASFNEETGTLTTNCLDLNCLYALDSWCLSQMANILNKREEYEAYLNEYERMKDLINKNLWNERESFYFDRHWNGKFSTKKAASNFFPLIARIPDEKRALAMIKHLLNPKEFWGDYIVPTISRDDPAFKDQQYWRGAVWPPTNYLIYQGLKAYEFDAVASEFARKSAQLFLRSWQNFQLCPENFDSRTGEAGGERHKSWGPLFALIALEEYLDFNPWEGFRFGMIKPEDKGKLSRVAIQGRHYEVEVSSGKIILREEDKEIFRANGGVVVRHFLFSENEISFETRSLEKRKIKIRFLKKGKYQLLIDNQVTKIFKGKSLKFNVPEGKHSVLILLLEAVD